MIKIFFLSLGSLMLLFIVTKLIGNKEISQMTMFDYIVSITIGSIAAEMATSLENNFFEPLEAIIIYGVTTVLISIFTYKFLNVRRIINGKALVLLDDGVIYKNNFKKAKLDINEFLMEARLNGYYNINDIQTAILETNGKISFLSKTGKRSVNLDDMKLKIKQESLCTNIILDGKILKNNLKNIDKDLIWLFEELKKMKINDIKDVFLGCYTDNKLSIYLVNNCERKNDDFK